jgi:hypothetical protein
MAMHKPLSTLPAALLAVLLCGLVGTIGCTEMATPPGNANPSNPAKPSAVVSFCNSTDPACTPAASFSVNSLRDLNIVVQWQNLPAGNHLQTLNVLIPASGLYQSFADNFQVAAGSQGTASITRALPVAGTWISQRSLTGNWQVQVSLDGQVAATQGLQLTR